MPTPTSLLSPHIFLLFPHVLLALLPGGPGAGGTLEHGLGEGDGGDDGEERWALQVLLHHLRRARAREELREEEEERADVSAEKERRGGEREWEGKRTRERERESRRESSTRAKHARAGEGADRGGGEVVEVGLLAAVDVDGKLAVLVLRERVEDARHLLLETDAKRMEHVVSERVVVCEGGGLFWKESAG